MSKSKINKDLKSDKIKETKESNMNQNKAIDIEIDKSKNTATFGKPVIIGLPPKSKLDKTSNKNDIEKSRNSKVKDLRNNLSQNKNSKTTNYSTFTSIKKTQNSVTIDNKNDISSSKYSKVIVKEKKNLSNTKDEDKIKINENDKNNSRNHKKIILSTSKTTLNNIKVNNDKNYEKTNSTTKNDRNEYVSTYNKVIGEIVKDLRIKFEKIIVDKNYPNYRIREDVIRYLNKNKEITPSWGNLSTIFQKCQEEFKRRISKYNSKPANIIEIKNINKLIEQNTQTNNKSIVNVNSSKLMKNILDHNQELSNNSIGLLNEKLTVEKNIDSNILSNSKSNKNQFKGNILELAVESEIEINPTKQVKTLGDSKNIISNKDINAQCLNEKIQDKNNNDTKIKSKISEPYDFKNNNLLTNKERIYENLLKIKLEKGKKMYEETKNIEKVYATTQMENQYTQNIESIKKEKLRKDLDEQVKMKKELSKLENFKKKDEELRIVKRIEEEIDFNNKKLLQQKINKKNRVIEFLEMTKKEKNEFNNQKLEKENILDKEYVANTMHLDKNQSTKKGKYLTSKEIELKQYLDNQVKEKNDKKSKDYLNEKIDYSNLLKSANREKEEFKRSQSTKKQKQISYKNELDSQVDEIKIFKKFNVL